MALSHDLEAYFSRDTDLHQIDIRLTSDWRQINLLYIRLISD